MRSNHHSNALLVELLIVVLFFMLAASVLLQVFAAARLQSDRAAKLAEAANWAQNVADRLYAADNPDEALTTLGFAANGESWVYSGERFSAILTQNTETGAAGQLRQGDLTVTDGEEMLISLPCARYEEVRQ